MASGCRSNTSSHLFGTWRFTPLRSRAPTARLHSLCLQCAYTELLEGSCKQTVPFGNLLNC
jgi:hypothetical protein